jgi:hypothetical protein
MAARVILDSAIPGTTHCLAKTGIVSISTRPSTAFSSRRRISTQAASTTIQTRDRQGQHLFQQGGQALAGIQPLGQSIQASRAPCGFHSTALLNPRQLGRADGLDSESNRGIVIVSETNHLGGDMRPKDKAVFAEQQGDSLPGEPHWQHRIVSVCGRPCRTASGRSWRFVLHLPSWRAQHLEMVVIVLPSREWPSCGP